MYISKYSSFDCASYLRSRKPKEQWSAPEAEVEACISKVAHKDDPLSCMFWFMRCMCCEYGRCTDYQKSKGMGKGKCGSGQIDDISNYKNYIIIAVIIIGAIMLLKRSSDDE